MDSSTTHKDTSPKSGEPMRAWDSRTRGPRLGNLIFMKLIRLGGPAPAYLLLRLVTFWYALFDKKASSAIRAFRSHLGLSTSFVDIYRHMLSFGESLVDSFAFLAGRQSSFTFSYVGEELFAAALAKGKGLILVSAHVGNFEVAGNLLFDRLKTCVHVIAVDEERDEMREIFKDAIEQRRVNIIPVTSDPLSTMIAVRTALAANEIVCVVGDRVSGSEDVRQLPFLGQQARFPVGPFVFGVITGAPTIHVFSLKTAPRRYLLKVYGSVTSGDTPREKRREAIDSIMRAYVRSLENVARAYPNQWFNFYDYWGQGESGQE